MSEEHKKIRDKRLGFLIMSSSGIFYLAFFILLVIRLCGVKIHWLVVWSPLIFLGSIVILFILFFIFLFFIHKFLVKLNNKLKTYLKK